MITPNQKRLSLRQSVRLLIVTVLTGVCTVASTAEAVAQAPEVISQVDRQEVYLGESIIFNVTLNHVEDPHEPTLDGFDDFQVELLGQQSQNSQQISIINGRRSEVIRRGMLYQYRLTPRIATVTEIPAPTTTVDGDVITGRPVKIRVIPPQDQDVVVLEMSVDKKSVYPLQPFTISLTIAIKQLPGELVSQSPLSVQGRSPVKLTASWLDDDQIPDGIQPEKTWQEVLQPILNRSGRQEFDGMEINNIGAQSAFSFFGSNRKTAFLPNSERTVRKADDATDAGYVEYTIQRTFVPQRIGEYRFSAVNVKGTFGTEFTANGLTGEDIYAVSNDVEIVVNDVPLEGRSESYIGGIGSFELMANVSPRETAVGDPITLSVTIRGQGTISDLRPPNIEGIAGIANNFRIYEATEETKSNGKVFTYSLRALHENVAEFPEIPFSYFDVNQEAYVTKPSAAIPLSVSAARKLSKEDIVADQSSPAAANGDGQLKLSDAGLFANHSSLKDLRSTTFQMSRWLSVWGMMIVGYVAVSLGLRRRQRMNADPQLLRRRNARARAADSLKAISASSVSADSLNKIVSGMVADFTGNSTEGMTSADAEKALAAFGVDAELQRRAVEFMHDCDATRYGAGSSDSESLTQRCRELIDELGRELNQRC